MEGVGGVKTTLMGHICGMNFNVMPLYCLPVGSHNNFNLPNTNSALIQYCKEILQGKKYNFLFISSQNTFKHFHYASNIRIFHATHKLGFEFEIHFRVPFSGYDGF